jgi:hypothetical protein
MHRMYGPGSRHCPNAGALHQGGATLWKAIRPLPSTMLIVRPVGVPDENVHRVRHLTYHFAEIRPTLIPYGVVWCSSTLWWGCNQTVPKWRSVLLWCADIRPHVEVCVSNFRFAGYPDTHVSAIPKLAHTFFVLPTFPGGCLSTCRLADLRQWN